MQCRFRQLPLRRFRHGWNVAFAVAICSAAIADDLQPRADFDTAVAPLAAQYCADCHSADTASDKAISFAPFIEKPDFQKDREFWNKVALRLHTSEMPPPDAEHPAPEDRAALVKWLRDELDTYSCNGPRDPGSAVLRRLNRTQYRNTVRDWLGVEFDVTTVFPPDELAYGFDNSGDALAMTTLQVEKYLIAAEAVASQAIRAPESITEPVIKVRSRHLKGGEDFGQPGRMLATDGVIMARLDASREGRYLLRARISADQAGPEPARMAFADERGRNIKELDVIASRDSGDPQLAVVPLELKEGRNRVGIAFLNDYYDEDHPDSEQRDRNLYMHQLELVGPLEDDQPESHRKLLEREPSSDQWRGDDWQPVVDETLARWLRDAYRRPVSNDDVARLRNVVTEARRTGATFERSMQLALQAILVSPQFLFIAPPAEAAPADGESFASEPIDEFTLASRLSYFLWSTMPDAQLLELAEQGALRKQLDAQLRRMLADDRAAELARNFGGSWLQTRELATVEPDTELFKEFDDDLRTVMQREAELFVWEIIRADRSVLDFITADFTFLNERLARHYGIDGVSGDEFRRVALSDPRRGGVLTMAAVLTVTSNPDRTSPVKRGKWVLGQLLGDEPPPPPPNVPDLAQQVHADKQETLREMLARHRADADCAVCHRRMDPMGLALENYDALGRWRETELEQPIDASGELPDGRKFEGAKGLRELLLTDHPMFRRNLVQQMLTYALGRGLRPADSCTISDIVTRLQEGDDKFSALVLGIVHSAPFQQQRVINPGEGY